MGLQTTCWRSIFCMCVSVCVNFAFCLVPRPMSRRLVGPKSTCTNALWFCAFIPTPRPMSRRLVSPKSTCTNALWFCAFIPTPRPMSRRLVGPKSTCTNALWFCAFIPTPHTTENVFYDAYLHNFVDIFCVNWPSRGRASPDIIE